MIFDVQEAETDETVAGQILHCVWIRHEARDQQGIRTLHYTLGASLNGKTVAVNFKAQCAPCRTQALTHAQALLNS